MMRIKIDGNFFEVEDEVGQYISWLEQDSLKQEEEKRLIADRIVKFSEKFVKEIDALDIDVYTIQNHSAIQTRTAQE